jgi:hypothetical protein
MNSDNAPQVVCATNAPDFVVDFDFERTGAQGAFADVVDDASWMMSCR